MSSSKRCQHCGADKSVDEFYADKSGRDGRRPECKACTARRRKEWYRKNRDREIARVQQWQRDHRDEYMAGQRAWREANAEEWKRKNRERHLRRKYGISQADYEAMLEAQGGGCGICGDPPPEVAAFHVDHDHGTGEVRGLLCVNCNNGLGQFREARGRLASAADYVERGAPGLLDVVELTRLARERAAVLIGQREGSV